MGATRRLPATFVLIVCLGSTQVTPVFAAEPEQKTVQISGSLNAGEATLRAMSLSAAPPFAMNASQPALASAFAQWGRSRGRGHRNGAAQAELVLGAVATIAGAAVLTYANRPDCSVDARADGCSYGTKVVGASVATAGVVTFLTGAFTWR